MFLPDSRWRLYEWRLTGCSTVKQFYATTQATFGIAEPVSNLDVLLHDITDPEIARAMKTLGSQDRTAIVMHGLEALFLNERATFDKVMSLLDAIVDRWREQVKQFHVLVISPRGICDAAQRALYEYTSAIEEAKRHEKWGPLPYVETSPVFRYALD